MKYAKSAIVAAVLFAGGAANAEEACIKALGGFVICGEVVK